MDVHNAVSIHNYGHAEVALACLIAEVAPYE